jgi:hypothetical protein
MNWFKRAVLSRFYSPELTRAVEAAGGLREVARGIDLTRDMRNEWTQVKAEHQSLNREAALMNTGPRSVPLKERFWELELALEDRGWQRQLALSALEFSRYGIQQLILISRLYAIKNPLIKRAVSISSYYVFGRGVEIGSEDPDADEVIKEFLEANKRELGHLGLMEKNQTLKTDGNLYLVLFTAPNTGQVTVRTIDATEIAEIIMDPEDGSCAWFYQRTWIQETFDPATGVLGTKPCEAWYPALGYDPPNKIKMIRGQSVNWDKPVYHKKTGGLPKWKFGCPEVYSSIDWARAYKGFLEDWTTITKALARFAYGIETQGGQQAIQQFSQILSTTLGDGGTQIERNPPPVVGASFVSGPGNKITPIKTAGATTDPEQGRRVLLMTAASEGLPETFFGDASTGSLATAQSLDRPTELMFEHRQELWRELLEDILGYVLEMSGMSPSGKLKEAKKAKAKPNAPIKVRVKFPSVLEHDIAAMVTAISEAMTLQNKGGQVTGIDERIGVGLLLSELGVEDVDTVLDEMYPLTGKDKYDPDRTKQDLTPPIPKAAPNPGGEPQAPGGTVPSPGQNAPGAAPPSPGAPAPAAPTKEARTARAIEALLKAAKRLTDQRERV